jgi:hypothetical protein
MINLIEIRNLQFTNIALSNCSKPILYKKTYQKIN